MRVKELGSGSKDTMDTIRPGNLKRWLMGAALAAALLPACTGGPIGDERGQGVGYRAGTEQDGFTSNGERGNVLITEINWAGSVTDDGVHDPGDIFIELQNKHPRPIHLTGWQLIIEAGSNHPAHANLSRDERPRVTYVIPPRVGGQPFQPNEYVLIAAKNTGAFRNVDYLIPDLKIPRDFFEITLRDVDDRLIEPAGSVEQEVFAGSFDLVTVRSMERIQQLFSNGGGGESSWHSYSYNDFDPGHAERGEFVAEGFKLFTFASPGKANSPDYSGNTSSGSFE